jgi:hypothetical protein
MVIRAPIKVGPLPIGVDIIAADNPNNHASPGAISSTMFDQLASVFFCRELVQF